MGTSRDLSLTTKGVLVVAIPVTALLLAMLVFYQFARESQNAEQAVYRTYEIRGETRRALTEMLNAETAIRGYILTGDSTFLDPYKIAVRKLPEIRQNLRRLVESDAGQTARLERVESRITTLMAAMERNRREIGAGNRSVAMAEIAADKAAMDNLRDDLSAMIEEAERLLAFRSAAAAQAQRRTSAAIFAGGALGLLGGVFATLLFMTRIGSRIRILEGEARDVAAGRTIAHEVVGDDEIARLERTLQETSELLTQRAQELHNAHSDLEARVELRTAELQDANEALRLSNDVREALVQSSPLAIWAIDPDGRVTFWNPAAERIFGWSEADVIGRPLPVIRDADLAEYRQWLTRFAAGESLNAVERKQRRKDGSEIDVMIWTAALRDSRGRIRGTIAIDSDVSQQKLLEEQFRQSQKLEAVGRLAGGVAHDFNNLLTVIQGYADMIGIEAEDKPKLLEYAREIEYAAGRAAGLTAQLLAFSRRQTSQPKILELNEVVTHSMKMLRRVIGEDIEIVTRLDPRLCKVKIDPIHIDQAIMNLVVNARDAMPNGGRLTIETKNERLDSDYAGRQLGVGPGLYCMLAIGDTGAGMPPETRNRIFEPFFTTKEAGKGTGLGLSIVYGIVKQSHGEITVHSELGRGTTFRVYLPIAEAPEEQDGLAHHALPPGGSETILVCEDDPNIRELVERMLGKQGYRVLATNAPADAIRIARENRDAIDLLLTDVVMPGMNGFDLAKEVTGARPEAKVLYMSGYTDNQMTAEMQMDAGLPFLQKPFTVAALSEKVREVLGRENGGGATSRGGLP
jgi:PAS domain S-box-containing protein